MCNLSGEGLVVEEEEVDLVHVVDQEFFQPVREQVASQLVASVTNLHKS